MKTINLAPYIDHTLLASNATREQIKTLCQEAVTHHFRAVCVNSCYVVDCVEFLKNSDVIVATVVGFSSGSQLSSVKAFEARQAVESGAMEVDMVLANWALFSGDDEEVLADILEVQKAVKKANPEAILKVIIETSLLNEEQKIRATKIVSESKAEFIKTSTGFHGGGASLEDVALMKKYGGDHLNIKASGGIRDAQFARELIEAGASRLGTSSGVKLVTTGDAQGGAY